MKILVVLLLLASIGANVWQLQHTSEVEEILNLQRTTVSKQKKALDQATKDLAAEKQNSSRTVKSAQGLLDRTEKLMRETDRLAAENAAYKQRVDALEVSKPEAAVVAVTPVPTPLPTPTPTLPPSPTPTPANAKKKR